jgi:hypothetical protein
MPLSSPSSPAAAAAAALRSASRPCRAATHVSAHLHLLFLVTMFNLCFKIKDEIWISNSFSVGCIFMVVNARVSG